jgi:FkbM family methyltransferase
VSPASQLRFLQTHIQVRGLLLGFCDWFRATAFNQRAEVRQHVPGSRHPALLRIGTSDLEVYKKVFLDREYEAPFPYHPKTILDLGANTGLASLFFSTRFPGAQIIAVEPDLANFALLKRNTSHLPQVTCIHAAVWSHDSKVSVIDPGIGHWAMQVTQSDESGTTVQALSMDSLLGRFNPGRADLVKIDIEGSERQLFNSSDPWLNRVSAMVIELHDRYQPGCARAFFTSIADFPNEHWNGENIWVWR